MANAAACGETLPTAPSDATDAATDGTSQVDGPLADGPISDGGPAVTTSCAFSDTFDRPAADVSAGWTEPRTTRGSVTLVDGTFQSATESGGPLEKRFAVLAKTFETPPKSLRCEFEMRIDTPPNNTDNYVDALAVDLEATDGTNAVIRLAIEHARIVVREDVTPPFVDAKCQCPLSEGVFTAEATTGEWMKITFTTNFGDVSVDQNGIFIGTQKFPALEVAKASLLLGVTNFSTGATTHSYRKLSCTLGC